MNTTTSPARTTADAGRRLRSALACGIAVSACLAGSGCQLPGLIGAIGQNIEREKKVEVLAKYTGLDNQSVAVLIHADMGMLYEYPMVKPNLASNVSARLQKDVPGCRLISPTQVMAWEYQTPAWAAMPMGHVCEALDVDRVVLVDVVEFRLNPPGNRWLWEGAAAANVTVFERDGVDPDAGADQYSVTAKFPKEDSVPRESLRQEQVEAGLVGTFARNIAWLFHDHTEDKYPDR